MKVRLSTLLLIAVTSLPLLQSCDSNKNKGGNAQYVNPFIGTGGHGHTFPGATRPFGMVQLSPDTRIEGWDGCSGYHYTDSVVYGFSHTHLSGTGVGDYCDILLKPCNGNVHYDNGYKTSPNSGYASYFNKQTEVAEAGYYSVELEEGIKVELTSTERAGFHRYMFDDAEKAHVILDLSHRDKLLDYTIDAIDETTIRGMRRSQSWADNQVVFFEIQFSKPIDSIVSLIESKSILEPDSFSEPKTMAFYFDLKDGDELLVKVGISAVDIEGASANLQSEIPHWDFDLIRQESSRAWNNELAKIQVEGDETDKVIFYSALYHTMVAPNLFSDVDGRYRKMVRKDSIKNQSEIGQLTEGENQYTVFSLWDTYRATHPLYTLIDEKRSNEFIRTFLRQYKDGGQLPVWELSGNYTGCMIGYHSVPVIADAYAKGIRDWDADLALEAMQHSATTQYLGLPFYIQNGFIPTGEEPESVSKTLEYAYDDWCIAQMAKSMNNDAVYTEYIGRAQNYKNLYNAKNGFLQGRTNGGWYGPFVPEEVNFTYTEANGWQYSLAVPHDVSGLIDLMGDNEQFVAHLDKMFSANSETGGRHQVDITGLIGQYAHGNEPSHHMAYLYSYADQPWKTQERVAEILETMYQNAPDGLSGNEDCGQMSAWYVLSSMGFYPVCPGSNQYVIGTPLFENVTINLENGKQFKITRNGKGKYIQSAKLNGEKFKGSFINHSEIMEGVKLSFEMGTIPSNTWGTGAGNAPTSSINENLSTVIPSINTEKRTFIDSLLVNISSVETDVELFYVLADYPKDTIKYTEPFYIHNSTTIGAFAMKGGSSSKLVSATLKKIKGGRSIKLYSEYANEYSAGGNNALIDELRGGREFRTGDWQGYRGNLYAVIDLGEIQHISLVRLGCLQDIKSWIWFPKEVKFYCSEDGITWNSIGAVSQPSISEYEYGAFTYDFNSKLGCNRVRFVKVEAENYGECPPWHLGAGGKTWLFADEIVIE